MRIARNIFVAMLAALSGCRGIQSSLDPAGVQAERIHKLTSFVFWICLVVYVLVIAVMFIAMIKKRPKKSETDAPDIQPDPVQERRMTLVVGTSLGITTLILFAILIGDLVTGRHVHAMAQTNDFIVIRVTARQWWWEVNYADDAHPANNVTTANEIHLPIGKPVKIELASRDVIHSFWIPNLQGKKDMIPGHPTQTWIQADRAGQFRGQCAEFCGQQHAHMRFVVITETEDRFKQWLSNQSQPGKTPTTDQQKRGQQVFLTNSCAMCHTVSGTPARAAFGPNLTHVASRLMLAAGTLPESEGHLAGWVANPQRIKPGVRMPQNTLSAQDLQCLAEYLQSLK